jgi:hypothetical protein
MKMYTILQILQIILHLMEHFICDNYLMIETNFWQSFKNKIHYFCCLLGILFFIFHSLKTFDYS